MEFDETKHEYLHNGDKYTSVTQLLKKYGLAADYTGIPEAVLEKAATKGKAVHKGLELFVGGDTSMVGLLTEVDLFSKYIATRNINLAHAKAEQMLFDPAFKIAGTIDFQYVDGTDVIVADFKTTSTLHLDTVSWQLSIYNYMVCKGDMMTYYFNKLKVFHFASGKMYVRDVHTIDYDEVKALLTANLQGTPTFVYNKTTKIITPSDETLIGQILNELNSHKELAEKLETELNTVLDRVKEAMVIQKDYRFQNADFLLTYIHPQVRRSLDSKKVKDFITASGKAVDDFMTETTTKDAVRAAVVKPVPKP